MMFLKTAALVAAVLILSVAAATAPYAQTIFVISENDCRLLTRYVPEPGVEYQPGVDVRGKEVASANLDDRPPIEAPKSFTIDIDVFLADRIGIPANPNLFVPEANVAEVRVDGDRVFFDGQPLSDLRQQAVADACREKLKATENGGNLR